MLPWQAETARRTWKVAGLLVPLSWHVMMSFLSRRLFFPMCRCSRLTEAQGHACWASKGTSWCIFSKGTSCGIIQISSRAPRSATVAPCWPLSSQQGQAEVGGQVHACQISAVTNDEPSFTWSPSREPFLSFHNYSVLYKENVFEYFLSLLLFYVAFRRNFRHEGISRKRVSFLLKWKLIT